MLGAYAGMQPIPQAIFSSTCKSREQAPALLYANGETVKISQNDTRSSTNLEVF
jgi:hypothetical protein